MPVFKTYYVARIKPDSGGPLYWQAREDKDCLDVFALWPIRVIDAEDGNDAIRIAKLLNASLARFLMQEAE